MTPATAPALLSLLVLVACQGPPAKTATDRAPEGYVDAGGGVIARRFRS